MYWGHVRTLFLSHVEGRMIDIFALFDSYFEGVNNFDLATILSSKESTKD
jgi:hypothetical protein